MFAIAGAVIFAALGVAALTAPRLMGREPRLSLAGVGEVSRVTVLVAGVSCLIIAYHIVTHALGIMAHFRAPLWLAFAGSAIAVLASLGVDAVDNRQGPDQRDRGGSEHD